MKYPDTQNIQAYLEERLTHLGVQVANATELSTQATALLSGLTLALVGLQREIEDFYIDLEDDLADIEKAARKQP